MLVLFSAARMLEEGEDEDGDEDESESLASSRVFVDCLWTSLFWATAGPPLVIKDLGRGHVGREAAEGPPFPVLEANDLDGAPDDIVVWRLEWGLVS